MTMNSKNAIREQAYEALASHDAFWFSEMLYAEELGLVKDGRRLELSEGDRSIGEPSWRYVMEDNDILIDLLEAETSTWGLCATDRAMFSDADGVAYRVVDKHGKPVDFWELAVKWHKSRKLGAASRNLYFTCDRCGVGGGDTDSGLRYYAPDGQTYVCSFIKSRYGELSCSYDVLRGRTDGAPLPGGTYACVRCGRSYPDLYKALRRKKPNVEAKTDTEKGA